MRHFSRSDDPSFSSSLDAHYKRTYWLTLCPPCCDPLFPSQASLWDSSSYQLVNHVHSFSKYRLQALDHILDAKVNKTQSLPLREPLSFAGGRFVKDYLSLAEQKSGFIGSARTEQVSFLNGCLSHWNKHFRKGGKYTKAQSCHKARHYKICEFQLPQNVFHKHSVSLKGLERREDKITWHAWKESCMGEHSTGAGE